jgi:hypothetical protein
MEDDLPRIVRSFDQRSDNVRTRGSDARMTRDFREEGGVKESGELELSPEFRGLIVTLVTHSFVKRGETMDVDWDYTRGIRVRAMVSDESKLRGQW